MILDLIAHLHRQSAFSLSTFGPGKRTAGVVDHIRKELTEIEAKPDDLEEWIDVVILAFDGAWRSGATPEEIVRALVAKQTKNEQRAWPDWRTVDPNKAIEHDRSGEREELLWKIEQAHRGVGSSAAFVAEQFGEHVETVVERAKIEIAAHAESVIRERGLQSLQSLQTSAPIQLLDSSKG